MSEREGPVVLTETQLRGLVAASGLRSSEDSPLSDLLDDRVVSLSAVDYQILERLGWLERGAPPRLTAKARAALEALCRPTTRASLLLGTRDTVGTMHAYSARGFIDGMLVSYTADTQRGTYRLLPGQSPGDLADVLTAQVLLGPLDETVTFQATVDLAAFVTLTCILDWRLQTLLASILDRAPNPDTRFTARVIWGTLVEGRTARDLTWLVTLSTYLFPSLNYELAESAIVSALRRLQAQGLLAPTDDGRYAISDPLLELADALMPVVSFAGLNVAVQDGAGVTSNTHLAILRGKSAILLVQPVVGESGGRMLAMDCVTGVELAEVLFTLGLPSQQLVGVTPGKAPDHTVCPACGAQIAHGRQFCTQCGAPLAAPQRREPASAVCPACGAAVKPGRRFCSQCGASLTLPGGGGR
jgi:predicted nucleic acid-binding Zn ribbon protein